MSAHKPASLPLQGRIKSTMNLRAVVRAIAVEQNLIAKRVVEYLHARILENPDRQQTYRHEEVGAALGIDPRKVRLSLAQAGGEWITVDVSATDRAATRKLAKSRGVKR